MTLHKISAPVVFDGKEAIENAVLVLQEDGTIEALLPSSELSADVHRLDEGWICPGFINAHCHLELSHLKDRIEPGKGMVDFLTQVMFSRQADASLVQYCMQNAEEQMLGHGIVAVGDICNTADSAAVKLNSSLYWHNFVEVTGFVPASAKQRFDQGMKVVEVLQQILPPKQTSIVPHAPYSVSAPLFELIQNHVQTVVCMHNQESEAEEMFLRSKQGDMLKLFEAIGVHIDFFEPEGKSSLQYSAHLLPMANSILLVHNCHTTEADLRFLHDSYELLYNRFSFCLCPNANLYIGNPLPNVHMLQQQHAKICLGTDSLASNTQLSILAEMQTLQQHFPDLQLDTLLQWATANGASALGIADKYGRFEKGTKPGVLWLENTKADGRISHTTVQRLY
ncbi:MAG TPA: amidohydrolase family protein [Phnomibacter sp.]|nr:amidohydrolase family protein [Phnomibacter sp.]